ncbi:ABC transporter-like protein [Corchorus olitorius]|uniref:ABC transporter-like protein n=1 Tax=Corchorus olitorius TaxID=93759 RepID=A0A1R3KEU6_9ROSI|nr:ABC transporter-like protein [Corchorus olitorius]
MAILGASGSGKSTLIDALANRISKHSLKGSITLNGEVLDSSLLKVISAYVMQDDLLFPMLTVEETLMFSAEFRLPRSLSKAKKKARVQALIDQLGLINVAKTVVGDEGHRGVSGGERRRVSIGIDIIHDPILLFLDEPTSGLDSTSAFKVVKVLQRIARSGSVVIMSIHQPSSRILSLVDRMILLSHGQTLYNSSPENLPQFFSDFGHPIPENENPSEFALDFIRELEVNTHSGTQELVEFNKSWLASTDLNDNVFSIRSSLPLKEAISKSISRGKLVLSGATAANDHLNHPSSIPAFANPLWIEVLVLGKRLLTNSRRMPAKFAVRIGTITATAIILATMFWQLDDSPSGVQERLGCIAISIATIFFNCLTEVPTFIQERYIFMRETAYNAYRRSSYVLSRSLIHIPLLFILSLTFSTITFWPIGLAGGFSGYLFFFVTIFASFWAGSSFAAFLSGLVPDVFLAFVSGVSSVSYFLFLNGFLVARNRIPKYWIWLHYGSLVKYPYEALIRNEFLDPKKCFSRGVQLFDYSALETLPTSTKDDLLASMGNVLGSNNISSSTCLTTGKNVLIKQGITELSKWSCVWVVIAWGFFFRILFYFTLLLGSKNKRK